MTTLMQMISAEMTGPEDRPLLAVRRLSVAVGRDRGRRRLLSEVDFDIRTGETVALVGESGSGKSTVARAILRLEPAFALTGAIDFAGSDLVAATAAGIAAIRGQGIGMVFQDPMTSLDPLMRVGDQIAEALTIRGVARAEARLRAIRMLAELGFRQPEERYSAYPHELSGGMRQRVGIAMALVGEPRLLIADEPTTALDVRIQQQVLDVLADVAERRRLAVLLITHDLGIVAGFADRVMVMYAGRLVETGDVVSVLSSPHHPYTRGLIAAVPRVDRTTAQLASIPGTPPRIEDRPGGCAFHPRCGAAVAICRHDVPPMRAVTPGRSVACHLAAPDGVAP